MLGLPKSTEFNKRIPKQKFYDNLTVSPTLKRIFVDQIRIIYWANKIAPSTLNLAEGKNVTEIEVFHIQLNQETLYENVLKQIDREIPYHILFVQEYDGKYKAVMGYKEAAGSGKASFKVAVYENFVRQIAGDVLQAATPQESLKESVARDDRRDALQKQMNKLQAKIRKEKQLNRQMEINAELKKLRRELEELNT